MQGGANILNNKISCTVTLWRVHTVFFPPLLPSSSILFNSKRALLWRFIVAGNNKTCFALYGKCPIFLSNFNQIWIVLTGFHVNPQYQISRKSVQWRLHWYMQTDGQDECNRRFLGLCRYVKKSRGLSKRGSPPVGGGRVGRRANKS